MEFLLHRMCFGLIMVSIAIHSAELVRRIVEDRKELKRLSSQASVFFVLGHVAT